jgi:phosphopantetheinyl transferase
LERPYPELGVSIAKRDGLTIVGFSPTQIVGVDIEIDQPEIDIDMLMRDHFAPGEGAALQRLPPADRRLVFFRLWTLKEAALKISGRGVFDGVSQPDLSATGAMSAALASGTGRVFCDGRPIHLAWTVLPGCHAALAIADAAA